MEYHDAANIFPMMSPEEIGDLARDIKTNGLRIPIKVCDGKIIDGRNRWVACEQAEVEPDTEEVDPEDPIGYTLSLNLHRRQLTTSQRAVAAAKAENFYAAESERANERKKRKPSDSVVVNLPPQKGKTRDKVGEAFGVSGSSVDNAKKVIEEGSEKLIAAVESDEVAVSAAAKLSKLPKAEQDKAIKGGKQGVKSALQNTSKKGGWKLPLVKTDRKKKEISNTARRAVRAAVSALRRALEVAGIKEEFEHVLEDIETCLKKG